MAQTKDTETQAKKPSGAKKATNGAYMDPFAFAAPFNGTFNGAFGGDKSFEKLIAQNQKQIDQFAQGAGDMGRESMEAFIKSSGIFVKGCEDIARAASEMAQSAAEKQSEFVKEALGSKTLNEWTEVQNKIAQANFDDFMAGATKISELGVKVLTDSAEPINAQMTKTIKKASAAAA